VKLLLDTCVWSGARDTLAAAGHAVIHAGDWARDPGDEEILDRAFREGRILVTLDKDFGELAIVRALPHAGIIRLVEIPARQQGTICQQLLQRYASELDLGALVTATLNRVRVRLSRP
jgi:predicted nuclease of predicted toxin-antitoxin system